MGLNSPRPLPHPAVSLHRDASWLLLLMMLMMSPPPPSIRATAAPPFSLLPERLTDRPTAGRWSIPHPSSRWSTRPWLLLLLLLLSTVSIDAPSAAAAAAEAEADSRILHVWKRRGQVVGWAKTEKNPSCWGDPRRRHRSIRALFWMGRGFTLCGRRVWVEVRHCSSERFFFRYWWVSGFGEDGICVCWWLWGLLYA